MKEIGKELRLARENKGFSLEEMSDRTRIVFDRLQAIENGDVAYFDHDISYLRYYIRFYCNALGVDFDQYRERLDSSIDDFHETKRLSKIESREETEKSIKRKVEAHKLDTSLNKNLDIPMVSLIIVVVIVLLALTSVFFVYILPQWISPEPRFPQSDPIIEPVDDQDEQPDDIDDEQPSTSNITLSAIDTRTYSVIGWIADETVAIKIEFGRDTWVKVSYDGVVTDNPASKIYKKDSMIEILYPASPDGQVMINLGGMNGNTIYVNGEVLNLDESIANWNTGLKLTFIFEGE